jgi:hypothetical protein
MADNDRDDGHSNTVRSGQPGRSIKSRDGSKVGTSDTVERVVCVRVEFVNGKKRQIVEADLAQHNNINLLTYMLAPGALAGY